MNDQKEQYRIRRAVPADAAALLNIYAPYVRETAITFEYAVPSEQEFAARIEKTLERYPYLLAENEDGVCGYVYAGPFHQRPAYDWSVETSIYVDRTCRKKGLGRLLHDALLQALSAQGILNLYACIAVPHGETDPYLDRNSLRFHEHMGYRLVGTFDQCGYKFHRWYDMVFMERQLGIHMEMQPPVKLFSEVQDK